MYKLTLPVLLLALVSCNPFNEDRVLSYQEELTEIVLELEKHDDGLYLRDEVDDIIPSTTWWSGIDLAIINKGNSKSRFGGFVEDSDSTIVLISRANNIFSVEKRIIYDFSSIPREFGSESIPRASYRIVQLNERWYYSEEGFD